MTVLTPGDGSTMPLPGIIEYGRSCAARQPNIGRNVAIQEQYATGVHQPVPDRELHVPAAARAASWPAAETLRPLAQERRAAARRGRGAAVASRPRCVPCRS